MFTWFRKRREKQFLDIIKQGINKNISNPNFPRLGSLSHYELFITPLRHWLDKCDKCFSNLKIENPQWNYIVDEEASKLLANVFEELLSECSIVLKEYSFLEEFFKILDLIMHDLISFDMKIINKESELKKLYEDLIDKHTRLSKNEIRKKYESALNILNELEQLIPLLKTNPDYKKFSRHIYEFFVKLFEHFDSVKRDLDLFAFGLNEFILTIVHFVHKYLQKHFIMYANTKAVELVRTGHTNIPQDLIKIHEEFINIILLKIREIINKLFASIPLKLKHNLSKIENEIKKIEHESKSLKLQEAILHRVGIYLIRQGYEEINQKKIIEGASLIDWKGYPKFIPLAISRNLYLWHGISYKPLDSSGSWLQYAFQNVVTEPREYVKRVLDILTYGLKPSHRADTQFQFLPLKDLQEVYFYSFYNLNEAEHFESVYGPIVVIFKPGEDFAVFEGIVGIGTNKRELFILTKVPVKAKFEVVLFFSVYSKSIQMFKVYGTRKEIKLSQYVAEVEELLKENNINYKKM